MLFNLISWETDFDKIHLYVKDLNKPKYQLLMNKWENSGLKHFDDSKAFIEYSNGMDDIRILNNTIQIENYWLFLMIWLLICFAIKIIIQ